MSIKCNILLRKFKCDSINKDETAIDTQEEGRERERKRERERDERERREGEREDFVENNQSSMTHYT